MRRGVVRDLEETTRAITKAMADAQRMAGVEVGTVYCGIAGEHVAGRSSHGMVSVTGDEIRTGDVARVNDMASNVSFGRDHELLHAIPQDYIIDQQPGISEPIGMTGSRLEAEVYLVTVLSSVLQNLRRAVERAGYSGRRIRAGAARGVAGGADPRRTRARLRHRGAGRRLDQRVASSRAARSATPPRCSAPGGTSPPTWCTASRSPSRTPSGSRSGSGRPTSRWCRKTTSSSCPSTPGQGARSAHRRVLAHIMHMRLQEVLEYALDEITRSGYHQRLPAGVVLTGGGAMATGIVELGREVFAMPVRVGIPRQALTGLADSVESPRMAVPAGLALYGARQLALGSGFGSGGRKGTQVEKYLAPVKRWLQDFF